MKSIAGILTTITLIFAAARVNGQDTVALIIGSQVLTTITKSVELFGCPNSASFEVEEFPFYNFLTGGLYLPGPQRALICGGYACPDDSQIGCEISAKCYFYSAEHHVWAETGPMPAGKLGHLMFMAPDMDNPGYGPLPVILGPDNSSLIYDPTTYLWRDYKDVTGDSVTTFMSLGCQVQYGDEIIRIGQGKVISLNTNTFEATIIADVPPGIGSRADTKCALGTTADGKDGVLTAYGYWFNLEDRVWSYETVTPLTHLAREANAMFTFRGKPTIFGNARCGVNGQCPYTGVTQYDSQRDLWVDLGDMVIERQMHEVIEVPRAFCDYFAPLPTLPPNPIPPMPTPPPTDANAALVVAGYWPDHDVDPFLKTAELFGCPGRGSIPVADFPLGSYQHAGAFIPSSERVLVCGGYSCQTNCSIRDNCYHFSPRWNVWAEMEPLNEPHWGHIMPMLNDINVTQGQKTPVVMGLVRETEIYDENLHGWRNYNDLPAINWYSTGCFLEHQNGMIYDLRRNATEFDPDTWTYTDKGELPLSVARIGKCGAIVMEDGDEGLLSRYGFYYRIADHTIHPMTTPPYPRHVQAPNCMATWRNKATLWGAPRCDGQGRCVPTAVWQFDHTAQVWVDMGDMLEPRVSQTVVEVPVEFCNYF